LNEKVLFPGIKASVQVVAIKSGVVRLGIEAPPQVTILREEVPDRGAEWGRGDSSENDAASAANGDALNALLASRLKVSGVGLELLRRQLQAGRVRDAQQTLDKVAEDLRLLHLRVTGKVPAAAYRPPSRVSPRGPCWSRTILTSGS